MTAEADRAAARKVARLLYEICHLRVLRYMMEEPREMSHPDDGWCMELQGTDAGEEGGRCVVLVYPAGEPEPEPEPGTEEPMRRGHRPGAPLQSHYRKLPATVLCEDCTWPEGITLPLDGGMLAAAAHQEKKELASLHAATAHHRVRILLQQEVIVEPKHSGTREKALGRGREKENGSER